MRKTNDEIATVIRERICLNGQDSNIVLHEGQLATEFGVSRTPIRQVLQMLSYENLVETRSGVGTIAPPLVAANRRSDVRAFRALLGAAAQCPIPDVSVPPQVLDRIRDAIRLLELSGEPDTYLVQSLAAQLEAMMMLVADHIVAKALRSAYWRHVRWCLHPNFNALSEARVEYETLLQESLQLAEEGAVQPLLDRMTKVVVGGAAGWGDY
ncbi:regulatory protein, gntR family [Pseudooceanicola antarcticus]|uniref:GntR family transcriptional regulator n=1 Tax=Pseudooceanicola antarcticus TaxID=1247613 RepID=A0A285HLS3_9RHOB|nr:GntR family transcriptional regulator [Pseudooceanicola antarcticus]PJE27948.1 GntR family transcriptional regulator [Pseudooceanicola antarcticus]SNY35716.1 regulatory protein, gntR family [Pseudooceanicola antarcticus]